MDAQLTKFSLRQRLELVWWGICLGLCLAALHILTDFNVTDGRWWRYLVERVTLDHEAPLPYLYFFAAWPVLSFLGEWTARWAIKPKGYGYARKATKRDLVKMELTAAHGIVLGEAKGHLLKVAKTYHSMIIAGTRSGKTAGIVIPTILDYPGSIVVIDPKGELWDKTAGFRSTMSDCYRVEWTSDRTARYDPLSLKVLPEDTSAIERRVAQLARIVVKVGDKDEYFEKAASAAFNTLALLEVYDAKHDGRDSSIRNVAHYTGEVDVEADGDPLTEKLLEAVERAMERGYPRRVVADLRDLATMHGKQRQGVLGTLNTELEAYRSGSVETALSGCDFTARSLVEGERPATVYIVVRPDDREFTASMTTALISNIVFNLVSRTESEAENSHSLLIILEEFSALRRTEAIPEAFDRGAGLKVHLMVVLQAFSQVETTYSKQHLNTFLMNTDWIVAFTQNDKGSRDTLAALVGQTTRIKESQSDGSRNDSFSKSYEGVQLVLPQEWGEIPFGEHRILVKYHHTRPVFAKTPFYFRSPAMKKRVGAPAPAVSAARPPGTAGEAGDGPDRRNEPMGMADVY